MKSWILPCNVVLLVVLVGCGEKPKPITEGKARRAIEQLGGMIVADDKAPGNPVVSINLAGSRVTDSGLVNLQPFGRLKRLNLDGTPISDKGLEHVKKLKKLQRLSVVGTKVTPDGLTKLKKALPQLNIRLR